MNSSSKHSVILDTNTLLSGILFGGNPKKILDLWVSDQIIVCLSPTLKAEVINKLIYKFSFSQTQIAFWGDFLDLRSKKYFPTQKNTSFIDPGDNFLLDLSEASQAEFLITGDKVLLKLGQRHQTQIISSRDFLEKKRLV